eukprot:2192539-Heterocapsa_arctica.AAC.2
MGVAAGTAWSGASDGRRRGGREHPVREDFVRRCGVDSGRGRTAGARASAWTTRSLSGFSSG